MDFIINTIEWIREDFNTNRKRFFVEVLAWTISISCSITMAFTVPNPPLLQMYAAWVTGCTLYAWAAWTRRSFGMFINYIFLASIDMVGLIRIISNV